jgi:hypothetical protein
MHRFRRKAAMVATGAVVLQFGHCQLNDINVGSAVTINGQDALIALIRGAVLTPIDQFITDGIHELFDDEDA